MAQLVKLLDYISRYENDLTRYPTQFIRLKRNQWERMKADWENGPDHSAWQQTVEEEVVDEEKWFSPLFRLFGSRKVTEEELNDESDENEDELDNEESFGFNPSLIYTPDSIEQLRKIYLDQLFQFQIKWASSTLSDKSRVHPKYYRDSLLRSFAQQLPDNYLLFYYPVLLLKKAPVELEVIIVTPIECMCITVLEEEDVAAFIGNSDRFWVKKIREKESKLLNPLIALNRTETILSSIFKGQEIDIPVRKYLISRNGYIDYPGTAFDVTIVDRRSYDSWFKALRNSSMPMKFAQFKAAQAILENGQTTAVSRLFDFDVEEQEIN